MLKLTFKTKIKGMATLSIIGSICVLLVIVGICINNGVMWRRSLLMYLICLLISNMLWRCPKCHAKLPKGKYTFNISKCERCGHDLGNK